MIIPVGGHIALPPTDKRHVALMFQNQNSDKNANGIYSTLSGLNSFLEYMDMPINFKGKRIKPKPDLSSHNFTNGDLTRMFEVADTKGKALLTLGTSLGWEVSAILDFDREYAKKLIQKAVSEQKEFYYFLSQRQKTGALRLGILNPLCLEWLGKWLNESKNTPLRKRKLDKVTKDRPVSNIFDLTEEGANKMVRRLATEARIVTTGRVHFHKIRGWVMSGLSRAGFNEFQIKFCVGKAIPMTDMTYLQTLQMEIEERYPAAYELYLTLRPQLSTKTVKQLSQQIESKNADVESLKQEIAELKTSIAPLLTIAEERLTVFKKSRDFHSEVAPKLEAKKSPLAKGARESEKWLKTHAEQLEKELQTVREKLKNQQGTKQ